MDQPSCGVHCNARGYPDLLLAEHQVHRVVGCGVTHLGVVKGGEAKAVTRADGRIDIGPLRAVGAAVALKGLSIGGTGYAHLASP